MKDRYQKGESDKSVREGKVKGVQKNGALSRTKEEYYAKIPEDKRNKSWNSNTKK